MRIKDCMTFFNDVKEGEVFTVKTDKGEIIIAMKTDTTYVEFAVESLRVITNDEDTTVKMLNAINLKTGIMLFVEESIQVQLFKNAEITLM